MDTAQGQVTNAAAAVGATVEVPGVPATQSARAPIAVGHRGLNLTTFDEVWRFASVLAKTDMAPKPYRNKAEDCFIAIQFGLELGLSPMQAVQNIAPINGKPSIYGPLGLALVEASGFLTDKQGAYEGTPYDDDYKYVFMTQRGTRAPHITSFSVAQAKKAGLWSKEGPWKNFPDAMLMWRAIWPNLNFNFADVLRGIAPAEIQQDAIEVTATPTPEPNADVDRADPLRERIGAVRDALHNATNGADRPATEAAIETEASPAGNVEQAEQAEQIHAEQGADRVAQFAIIEQLAGEVDALSPGASHGILLAIGGTTATDDLTGEQIADMQQKLAEVRDQLAAARAATGEGDGAATEHAEQAGPADAPATEATDEDPEARAKAIARVNALVDQIDQVRDGAGGTALYDFLGTMDLDAVALATLLETESKLTTTLSTVKKPEPAQTTKNGAKAEGKPGPKGQRSML